MGQRGKVANLDRNALSIISLSADERVKVIASIIVDRILFDRLNGRKLLNVVADTKNEQ